MRYLKYGWILLLGLLICAGFYYRLKGIETNHSFWSDEAYVSNFAREILFGKDIFEVLENISYQKLQVVITSISFTILGVSEFSARFPSVIFGTLGIVFAYLLATKLSDKSGGLLATFLYAFAQVNLANATQAKPYALLQTLVLIVMYLITRITLSKNKMTIHFLIVALCSLSSITHYLGVLTWIPYLAFLVFHHKQYLPMVTKQKIMIPFIGLLIVGIFIFQVPLLITYFLFGEGFPPYNQLTYFRELVWRNYGFITLSALVGIAAVYRHNKLVSIAATFFIGLYAYLWNFHSYSHNIRYFMPVFGIFFVFFGTFWSMVGNLLFHKKSAFVCLMVAMLLYVGGYKIVRKPSVYYSPNADFYGDVQNADYKSMYSQIIQKYPDINSYVIYNDGPDTQLWYMNGRAPDATFVKPYVASLKSGETKLHDATKKPVYTSLKQFQDAIRLNPRGILIVEDWESYLLEDVKQYAKKNLKRVIRVEGLPQADDDNWPLEVYSWGM